MAKELTDFRQGDTKLIKLNFGVGVDITGYKAWFTLRVLETDATPTAQAISTAGGNALDDILDGIMYVEMTSAQTKVIPVGKYLWDVQSSIPGSPPQILTVAPSVSRVKEKVSVLIQITKVDT